MKLPKNRMQYVGRRGLASQRSWQDQYLKGGQKKTILRKWWGVCRRRNSSKREYKSDGQCQLHHNQGMQSSAWKTASGFSRSLSIQDFVTLVRPNWVVEAKSRLSWMRSDSDCTWPCFQEAELWGNSREWVSWPERDAESWAVCFIKVVWFCF